MANYTLPEFVSLFEWMQERFPYFMGPPLTEEEALSLTSEKVMQRIKAEICIQAPDKRTPSKTQLTLQEQMRK